MFKYYWIIPILDCVKEKHNLFSHEQWALETPDNLNITKGTSVSYVITNEYSTIGKNSLKLEITNTIDGAKNLGPQLENTKQRTLLLSCDIKTTVTGSLGILGFSTTWETINYVSIPVGESSISMSCEVPSTYSKIWCRISFWGAPLGSIIYTDNWCLEEITD